MRRTTATTLLYLICVAPAMGALQPMDDQAMAEVNGQAGFSITQEFPDSAPDGAQHNFNITRPDVQLNQMVRGPDLKIIDSGGVDEVALAADIDGGGANNLNAGCGPGASPPNCTGAFVLQNLVFESDPIFLDFDSNVPGSDGAGGFGPTGRSGFVLSLESGNDLASVAEWGILADSANDVVDNADGSKLADMGFKYPSTGWISITAPDPAETSAALVVEMAFPSTDPGDPFADGGLDFFLGDEDGYDGGTPGFFNIYDMRLTGAFYGEADSGGAFGTPSIVLTPIEDQLISFSLGMSDEAFATKTDGNTVADFINRIPGGTSITVDTASTGNAVQVRFRGDYVMDMGITNIEDGDALFNMDAVLTGEPGIRLDVDAGGGGRDPALVVSPLVTDADLEFALQLGPATLDSDGVPTLQKLGGDAGGPRGEPGDASYFGSSFISANQGNLLGIAKISGLDMTGTNLRISAH